MFSIVAHGPRDLRVEEIEPPAAPGPGEVGVDLRVGGICGSDLHYFHHGGFGTVRLKQPMILGHEVAGVVACLGDGVTGLQVGQTVAVNPSMPCGACANCRRGRANLCTDMRFNGSAMRLPHVQGLFRETVVVPAGQAIPVSGFSPSRRSASRSPSACTPSRGRARFSAPGCSSPAAARSAA